jgi:glutathione synthase/RimK-type ligase-like ATP-grasp enzyme
MTKYRIYPYKQGSASAKKLAEALEGKVLKHAGSKYRPRLGDVVINCGSSALPVFAPATTLNTEVQVAQCKLATFKALSAAGVRIPDCFEGRAAANAAPANVFPLVARTVLRGHSGAGIVICNNVEELVDAPLYTRYIKKKDEYRVHVFSNGGPDDAFPFFVQRKARKLDVENPNWQVRNLEGGFVFVEAPINEVPQDVLDQAENALIALGLDFGGVDVIWNEKEGKAFVLEVNTACGLEDRTADRYKQAIADFV